jgi:cytidylate kinase
MSIITIFGLAGTGTSSCGKLLAKKLSYEFLSTGNLFRMAAKEIGLELYDYEKLLNENPEKDREFDQKIKKIGEEKNNLIVDSRLAWYFIPHSIKIKFTCPDNIRLKRICLRDNLFLDEAKRVTFFRENSHMIRYKNLYQIENYTDDKNFDFVIDTSVNTPEEIIKIILKKIRY